MIDVQGRTVIPGLNDSHMHIVREGLTYNMELRWDGVPSLADALRMLRRQAERVRGYPHCRICHPLPPANPQDARRGVRQPGQDLRRR
jgi:predicted amidohydrolase YtcJ